VVMKFQGVPEGSSFLTASLEYSPLNSSNHTAVLVTATCADHQNNPNVDKHYFRSQLVDLIQKAMALMKGGESAQAQQLVKQFINDLKKSSLALDPYIKDLLKDLEGQVTEAISKKAYYEKWGRHYLPSLASAHLHQQANNFKDPGVQHYGGPLFSQLRDSIDEVFCKLPPPKPSHYTTFKPSSSGSSSSYQAPAPLTSMSTFHSSGNPCFSGTSLVLMANGETRRVDSIQKGDQVKTPSGVASVRCVVKSHC